MWNQKGIELSINMLVVIIISLVVLGLGITLLYKFVGSAEEIQQDLDSRTKDELRRLLINQGKQVALSARTATVQRGSSELIGLGILNTGEEQDFQLRVELSKVISEQGADITSQINAAEAIQWWLYDRRPFPIESNGQFTGGLLVTPSRDMLSGQYFFKLRVHSADGEQYGNTQNIVLNVV